MALDRHWIESHIPHQGPMCLLDEVLNWNPVRVQCRSSTHRDPGNPLRAEHRLDRLLVSAQPGEGLGPESRRRHISGPDGEGGLVSRQSLLEAAE